MRGALLERGARALWAPELSALEALTTPVHLRAPVERLVRGAHLLEPERADWLLRARIYSDRALNSSEWGLVKVAAKRHSALTEGELSARYQALLSSGAQVLTVGHPPAAELDRSQGSPARSIQEAADYLLAKTHAHNRSLLARGEGQLSPLIEASRAPTVEGAAEAQRRWRGSRRAVGALLLDAELRPWGLSFKQPERHPLYHAEWALLDGLLRAERPPVGPLTLISTLKPCKLCAGAWVSYSPQPLSVYYVSDDPGKMGHNTAFDRGSFAWEIEAARAARCKLAQL